MTRVVVIGAGFGGLACALRLAAAGYDVTICEALSTPGGRARRLQLGPYAFDTGPTLVTVPSLLQELWELAQSSVWEDLNLIRLTPYYRILFSDGADFTYWGDSERDLEELKRFDRAAPEQYAAFLRATARINERAFQQLAHQPFHRFTRFLSILPELLQLGAYQSTYRFASSFFRDPHLRMVFSFHPLFIGGNPMRASAIYSIIPYLERSEGVYFPAGGVYAVVLGLVRLLDRLGVTLRLSTPVTRIHTHYGRVSGVETADGSFLPADIVVANSDVTKTIWELLSPNDRPNALAWWLHRARYSMSCYLLYLGLNRSYHQLAHHTIIMPLEIEAHLRELFDGDGRLSELAFYLNAPTRTDTSFAPPGHDALYVLVPVPHLGHADCWDTRYTQQFRERAVTTLETLHGLSGLRQAIVTYAEFTPRDFAETLRSWHGSAFSLEPTLFQSAYFRPHNRSPVPGLYFVGAGTHPGAGLPGVLLSATVTAGLIDEDFPITPGRVRLSARAGA